MFTLCSASIHPESRREGERAEPLDKPAPLKHKPSMTFLRPFLVVLALLLAFPAPAQPGAQTGDPDWLYRGSDITRDPAWRFGTLPNGLKYAVRRNTLPAGQVSIRIRIDAGALHEEDGERGWAHFIEHMLFRGTESFPDRRARQIWQELGASFIPFSAQTRISGVDLEGRQVRKGAADAVEKFVTGPGGKVGGAAHAAMTVPRFPQRQRACIREQGRGVWRKKRRERPELAKRRFLSLPSGRADDDRDPVDVHRDQAALGAVQEPPEARHRRLEYPSGS